MVQTSLAGWLKKPQSKHESSTPTTVVASPKDGPEKAAVSPTSELEAGKQQMFTAEPADSVTKTSSTLQSRLPPNATIAPITADTLSAFRRMTALLLPVPYPDKFYNEILTDEVASSISLVALWSSSDTKAAPRVVAGIRCRLISHPAGTHPAPSLYISTVTTLAPFRGHGLARALLREVTRQAIELYDVGTVTAHMWEANEEAGEWYEKMGFKRVQYEKEYYRKLKPGGAWLFEKMVGPRDLL